MPCCILKGVASLGEESELQEIFSKTQWNSQFSIEILFKKS